jgi:hypothetical protein
VDPLAKFFITKLELLGLLDIMPTKLSPTWRNIRKGEALVAKWIYLFMILEDLLE